jgi:hypothetical protein
MRFTRTAVGLGAALILTGAPALAGQRGHASTPPAHGHPTAPTPTSSSTKTASPGKTSTTTTTSGTTTPTMNPIATKIQANSGLHSKVTAMLPIDPKTGKTITLDAASMGFKNQGQFIAALHVSQNLGISFLDLKSAMVTKQSTASGTTMTQTGSLGHAIQTVKHMSSTAATTQATKAEQEAENDLKASTTTNKKPGTKKSLGDQ